MRRRHQRTCSLQLQYARIINLLTCLTLVRRSGLVCDASRNMVVTPFRDLVSSFKVSSTAAWGKIIVVLCDHCVQSKPPTQKQQCEGRQGVYVTFRIADRDKWNGGSDQLRL